MSSERKLALTVTIKDCEVQTFRVGGNGGQKVNKTSSGVRIIHHPSGARGEARESRSQLQNKRAAFRKMAESPIFKGWLALQLSNGPTPEEYVAQTLTTENLRIETRESGTWKPIPHPEQSSI